MNNNIISCEFNIDTVCVEVKLIDGSMVSIDCTPLKMNMQTICTKHRNLIISSTTNL